MREDPWSQLKRRSIDAPSSPALIIKDAIYTYSELVACAEQIASTLEQLGVNKGDIVALHLSKSFVTYAVLAACTAIGAPYVALDPSAPYERTAAIIRRAEPKITFTFDRDFFENSSDGVFLLPEDDDGSTIISAAANPSLPFKSGTIHDDDPIYIMFTSGSTGEPKGAVIPCRGVERLMHWARSEILTGDDDKVSGLNPLHFDNSIFDLFCGMYNGAALISIETAHGTNPALWLRTLREAGATTLFAVPTLYMLFDDLLLLNPENLPSVRRFVFGGEGFPPDRLRAFMTKFNTDEIEFINVYGPTETSCICSYHRVTRSDLTEANGRFVTLGRLLPNFIGLILDDDLTEVPSGEVGELWLGGPSIGLGYIDNHDQTKAYFRRGIVPSAPAQLFYKTGDNVRRDEQGCLYFIGRGDNQIKLRGHRVELDEIDLAIQQVPDIKRALSGMVTNNGVNQISVIYVANRQIDDDEILRVCDALLPHYMRPSQFIRVSEIPTNRNGKANRLAISEFIK